jgi:hypothetical protein
VADDPAACHSKNLHCLFCAVFLQERFPGVKFSVLNLAMGRGGTVLQHVMNKNCCLFCAVFLQERFPGVKFSVPNLAMGRGGTVLQHVMNKNCTACSALCFCRSASLV